MRWLTLQEAGSWALILLAVGIALAANTVSTKWATTPQLFNQWLAPMLALSPLVFITFGLAASRAGLANASATIDSLLTVSTILVGLIFFKEWGQMSLPKAAGILLVVIGIVLMRYQPQTQAPPPLF
jgi:multidrug transporter EmrE-like cation transporter